MNLATGHLGLRHTRADQRGNTLVGVIVGLLVGLGIALGVALYIAKVPVPFVDKVGHRNNGQDPAEAERLRNWDPNAGLAGKPAARPASEPSVPASAPVPAPPPPPPNGSVAPAAALPVPASPSPVAQTGKAEPRSAASTPTPSPAPASAPTQAAKPARDPAAILAGQEPRPAESKPAAPAADGFVFFVQAGAYSNANDAEQQRARLALLGLSAKLTEREQAGRTVYRVRLGPFDQRKEAEQQQEQLKANNIEAALIGVERSKL